MLLFKHEYVAPILEGRKTQTRRLWIRRMAVPGAFHWAQTGYGKPETRFARLEILRVWQEPLGDISEADSRAEGYDSRADYLNAFHRIYRTGMDTPVDRERVEQVVVWCVEFKVAFCAQRATVPAVKGSTPMTTDNTPAGEHALTGRVSVNGPS